MCLAEITGGTCSGDQGSFMGVMAGKQWVQHGVNTFFSRVSVRKVGKH